MSNKKVFLISLACVIAGICLGAAVTSSPYDGTGWNTAAPNDEALAGNAYQELQDLRKGVGIRMDKEHIDMAASSVGGEHMQGSARAFYLATASIPALQPDGTALAATDNGMSWHDTTTNIYYTLDDYSDPTVDGGWLPISHFFGDIAVNTNKFTVAHATGNTVVAGTLGVTGVGTFTAQSVHTAGLLANDDITLGAGDDLVGSATSQILFNTDKFTVDGATGNTLVAGTFTSTGVATIADGSLTATAAAPTDPCHIANKAYVDAQVAANVPVGAAVTVNDSTAAAMLAAHAYLTQTAGFVTAYNTDGANGFSSGYVDTDDNPASGGVKVAFSDTAGNFQLLSFFVASGKYFEIVFETGTAVITWTPLIAGGGAPIDQEAP